MKRALIFSVFILIAASFSPEDKDKIIFMGNSGKVSFTSNAPLEVIKAESGKLQGAIDPVNRTFLFRMPSKSFYGFNSGLQQSHFNENYLESDKYPFSVFKGKIIESVDLSKPGKYNVRAKGILNIHGVEKEKIIRSIITVEKGSITVNAVFPIELSEFNIRIPKILNEKIATKVMTEVNMTLFPR